MGLVRRCPVARARAGARLPAAALVLAGALILVATWQTPVVAQQSMNVEVLAHVDEFSRYNDVWGYTAPNGDEFAILGLVDGVAFYDVTNPSRPQLVGNVPAPASIWRDMKTYQHYCYAVTEARGAPLQVIDLSNPREPVLAATVSGDFQTAHNLFIDEAAGRAYIVGTDRGMIIYDLTGDPLSPRLIGAYNAFYIHDIYVQNDLAFAAHLEGGRGRTYILDVSDPMLPSIINEWVYPGAVTHNTWVSADMRILVTSDETGGGHLNVWEVSTPQSHQHLGSYQASSDASIHNAFVRDDLCIMSYYTEGLRIVSLEDPTAPVELGYYDTFAGRGLFDGMWGVYPFAQDPSIIYGSDIQSGLYVFRFNNPLTEVRIAHEPPLDTIHPERLHRVVARVVSRAAAIDPASVLLHYRTLHRLRGTGEGTLAMLPAGMPDEYEATIPAQRTDTVVRYFIEARDLEDNIGTDPPDAPATMRTFVIGELADHTRFDMEGTPEDNLGWMVSGEAAAGTWERAVPVASWRTSGDGSIPVTPEEDHTGGAGTHAWVTENGSPGQRADDHDVDGGETRLVSPAIDLAEEPYARLRFWLWYSNSEGGNPGADAFSLDASSDDGVTWVNALSRTRDTGRQWEEQVVELVNFVELTDRVRVRFVARDRSGPSLVEAVVDDVTIEALPMVAPPATPELAQSSPNPLRVDTTIEFELAEPGTVRLRIYNGLGRLVRELVDAAFGLGVQASVWDGRDERGRPVPSGIYFYRLEANGGATTRKLVVAR